jgi:hypothetical protein
MTCNSLTPSLNLTVDILIKLRAVGDPKFKVDFHVDFSQIEFIAKDVRSSLK